MRSTLKSSRSTCRSVLDHDRLPAALMAQKAELSAASNNLPPDHAPLWRIKGGSAILQVDDYEQRVRVKSGLWQSQDILRLLAQDDSDRYGHV